MNGAMFIETSGRRSHAHTLARIHADDTQIEHIYLLDEKMFGDANIYYRVMFEDHRGLEYSESRLTK